MLPTSARTNKALRQRLALTAIWCGAFLCTLIVIETYIYRYIIWPPNRMDYWKPIAMVYGSHLTGILAFWYVRPFPRQLGKNGDNLRFRLALILTVFYNCALLFILSSHY